MNAKEMFQKIGYEEIEPDISDVIIYENGENDYIYSILVVEFNKKTKSYHYIEGKKSPHKSVQQSFLTISTELHKAVSKQIEELGW